MKTLILITVFICGIFNPITAQFSESFDGADPLSKWSGDKSSWQIIPSSALAGGATNSKTLKLNVASGGGTKYLSLQIAGSWGDEQTWSFWMGRDGREATATNQTIVWLYSDRENLNDPSVNGYRIRFGDNTQNGDDIVLERVINGNGHAIFTIPDVVADNTLNYGIGLVVKKNRSGYWEFFTSGNISSSGTGINANSNILEHAIDYRNGITSLAFDNTFLNFNDGYLGIEVKYTDDQAARKSVEFDQLNFSPSLEHKNYVWTGVTNNLYNESTNWEPNRILKRNSDILTFPKNASIQQVESDVIESLIIESGTEVTFNNNEVINYTLVGFKPLSIPISSIFNISSNISFTLKIPNGVKGEIEGEMSVSKQSGNVTHLIDIADEGGLEIKGKFIQNCNGNIFGSSSKTKNNVTVKNTGEFIQKDGANPFALAAPLSKIVFEEGSWYRHLHNSGLSFGRNYSNFELNNQSLSKNIILKLGSNNPTALDNLLITSGNIVFQNESLNFNLVIKGHLTIQENGSLWMNSSDVGMSIIELIGINSMISGSNKINFGTNSILKISNNTRVNNDLTINGTLFLNSGQLNLNNYNLNFGNGATIQVLNGSLSASPNYNSTLRYIYGDGSSNPIIHTGLELMGEVFQITLNNEAGVTLNKPVRVLNELRLIKGTLFSNSSNFLTLSSVANAFASNNSFVDGPLAKEINNDVEFKFPIGSNNRYRPLTLIPSPGNFNQATFKATYFNETPPTKDLDIELKSISEVQYWSLDKSGEDLDGLVKLGWELESEHIKNNLANLRVAKLDGDLWTNAGRQSYDEVEQSISTHLRTFGLLTFGLQNESPTPVAFISFTGYSNGNSAIINWKTAAEFNNKGFEVEKSLDGITFYKIGFLESLNDQKEQKSYIFNDLEFFETSFYRLRQVDHNEEFNHSSIIRIEKKEVSNVFLFPNPAKESIQLQGTANGMFKVEIRNLQGIYITSMQGLLNEVNEGLNSFIKEAARGLYVVRVFENANVHLFKLMKE